jgi:DNA polymerase-3 subunit epsilon
VGHQPRRARADEAADIHGYTTARVQAEGQDPATALDEIATRLADAIGWGMPLVAFNTSFDWSVLHYDLLRNGLPTVVDRVGPDVALPLIDPHVIDKQVSSGSAGRAAQAQADLLSGTGWRVENWHEASADATGRSRYRRGAVRRAVRPSRRRLWDRGPAALFAAQQRWRAEQQDSLAAWFSGGAEHEKAATVRREWPLLPAPEPPRRR